MKKIKEILKAMPREKEMEAREKIGVAMWPKATPLQRCINLQNIITGLATSLAKFPEETRAFINTSTLTENVKRLYARKAKESLRTRTISPF